MRVAALIMNTQLAFVTVSAVSLQVKVIGLCSLR